MVTLNSEPWHGQLPLAAIAHWCEEHGTLLISDEIYHGVTYGTRAASAWETSRSAVHEPTSFQPASIGTSAASAVFSITA